MTLEREGDIWTQQDNDQLLDLYLAGYGLKTISTQIQRSISTLKNHIWKLATGYGKNRQYVPLYRKDPRRDSFHYTRRELEVLELGLFGEGQRATTERPILVDVAHIANVLNCQQSQVQKYVNKRKPQTEGFFQ